MLSQKNLPNELTKRVQRHHAASTLQKYSRKYLHTKRQLCERLDYFNDIDGVYDPTNPEIVLLITAASKILKRQDYDDPFWRSTIGRVYIGLKQYSPVGPNWNNYMRTEIAFKKILINVMEYSIPFWRQRYDRLSGRREIGYLEDEHLYTELVEYVLGHND
jgi:hypothetical protein